ncbi:MAG: sulfur carrier protein ThiS, partial [Leptolyngbyaceae cyanobacterium]
PVLVLRPPCLSSAPRACPLPPVLVLPPTPQPTMPTLTINGEIRQTPPELSLPQLLESIGMNPRLVAVEYNGEILHRQFWDSTVVQEGDRLEIVTIVGGGC